MKQLLLLAVLLGGCAALNKPQPRPVDIIASSQPVEVTQPKEVEIAKPSQPVSTPVEVSVPVAKVTRYTLVKPLSYSPLIPRVEKFFDLAVKDPTVLNRSSFTYSTATSDSIRENIKEGFDVIINTYSPSVWKGGAWSKVIGYQSKGTVFLNTKYVNRPDCEVINTIVHETMHNLGYSHGGNDPKGKGESVPYWVGDRAEQLCEEGKI
jgi:hypothetical protein